MNPNEILRQVTIPKPCSMDWDRMRGDERSRFCDSCGKQVHDLTAMNAGQAAALLDSDAGRGEICARIFDPADGNFLSPGSQVQSKLVTHALAVPHPVVHGPGRRARAGFRIGPSILDCRGNQAEKANPIARQEAHAGAANHRHVQVPTGHNAGMRNARIAAPSDATRKPSRAAPFVP